ncbi:MAG: IS110 family transposase [Actinomycetota bacterium]|nr:IS110 family transposase [Actinomycetota bacterium]
MTIVDARVLTVTGGVDTHLDFHVAAALDQIGGELGIESFETTTAGYQKLLDWLSAFGPVTRIGVEGTGSYGTGLARFLYSQGVEVVEVDRPNRQLRHRRGKSDPTDAVAAARAALSGQATGTPKLRNGPMEQMRVLLVARRSGREQRVQTLNQIRQLVFCAPEPIRERFLGRTQTSMLTEMAALRPSTKSDPVTHTTLTTLRDLARRIRALDNEKTRIRKQLHQLVTVTAPDLLAIKGLAAEGAAVLLAAAGDNPQRVRTEAAWAHMCGVAPIPASSGKTVRHRLNRGGNRQANSVLYRIVITRMSADPRTQAYVQRRRDEGRTTKEIIRTLKRYLAREIYKHLPRPDLN